MVLSDTSSQMVPRMSRYGAYVPGLASCWRVLDRLVQCWVALTSAVIVVGGWSVEPEPTTAGRPSPPPTAPTGAACYSTSSTATRISRSAHNCSSTSQTAVQPQRVTLATEPSSRFVRGCCPFAAPAAALEGHRPAERTRRAGDQGCCGVEVRGFEPLASSVRERTRVPG
jgi:hypothetical protein